MKYSVPCDTKEGNSSLKVGVHLSDKRISNSGTGCGLKGHLWAIYNTEHDAIILKLWDYLMESHLIQKMKLLFFTTEMSYDCMRI